MVTGHTWVGPAQPIELALANIDTTLDALLNPARFPGGSRVYLTNVYEPSDGVGQSSCLFGFDYSAKLSDLEDHNQTGELPQSRNADHQGDAQHQGAAAPRQSWPSQDEDEAAEDPPSITDDGE